MPALIVVDACEGTFYGVAHIGDIIVLESEAVAVVICAVKYAVFQTADFTDDRDGAVTQGDHLG